MRNLGEVIVALLSNDSAVRAATNNFASYTTVATEL